MPGPPALEDGWGLKQAGVSWDLSCILPNCQKKLTSLGMSRKTQRTVPKCPGRCQDNTHGCGSVVWLFLSEAATVPGDQPVTNNSLPVTWVAPEISAPGEVPLGRRKMTAQTALPKPPSAPTLFTKSQEPSKTHLWVQHRGLLGSFL